MELSFAPGATPPDPDELKGLIPSHISTQAQLNEWEMHNILDGEKWAFSQRGPLIIDVAYIRQLHKRMFDKTWRWAGTFRTSEKNIGVAPSEISPALHNLCEDVKTQLEYKSYSLDEIAARFSHRLVAIHPFPNGNGRLSRLVADLLLEKHGVARFTWGASDLVQDGEIRRQYIAALREADDKNYGPLLSFVRS